ncbi:MAG TPA: hypothetical protein VI756_02670 [Blastocatellia bacterium]
MSIASRVNSEFHGSEHQSGTLLDEAWNIENTVSRLLQDRALAEPFAKLLLLLRGGCEAQKVHPKIIDTIDFMLYLAYAESREFEEACSLWKARLDGNAQHSENSENSHVGYVEESYVIKGETSQKVDPSKNSPDAEPTGTREEPRLVSVDLAQYSEVDLTITEEGVPACRVRLERAIEENGPQICVDLYQHGIDCQHYTVGRLALPPVKEGTPNVVKTIEALYISIRFTGVHGAKLFCLTLDQDEICFNSVGPDGNVASGLTTFRQGV